MNDLCAHIVLLEPQIPWNTGNAGRSCLAVGAQLHLVGPLGFSLDEKAVRRAGLDYWSYVHPTVSTDWTTFAAERLPSLRSDPWFLTPDGRYAPWTVDLSDAPVLVFGSEGAGLPRAFRHARPERTLAVPMLEGPVRALNLSTTVGILLYEVLRQRALCRSQRG